MSKNTDKLIQNESLAPGDSLISLPKKTTCLKVQADGNVVLYRVSDSRALWATGTAGKKLGRLTMQHDGNLVLYGPDNKPLWDSHTYGNNLAWLWVRDDGSLTIRDKGQKRILWDAHTTNFQQGDLARGQGENHPGGFDLGHWAGNAVKSAGHAVGSVAHSIQDEAGKIGKELSKVPVVGGLLHGLFDSTFFVALGPVMMTEQVIIEGGRLDKVVLGQLKAQLQDFKEVGPYAQMVCSFIPGVGTAISAAIGCGLALANGQGITDAILAGVKGALPGGPLAKAAFDLAQGALTAELEHKPLNWQSMSEIGAGAVLTAIAMPDSAKKAIVAGLHCCESLATGKRIDTAVVGSVAGMLPIPDAAKKGLTDVADLAGKLAGGQRLDKALLDEVSKAADFLPVSADVKKSLTAGLNVTTGLIQGKPAGAVIAINLQHAVTDVLLDHGKQYLPKEAKDALQIGVAMAQGRIVQAAKTPQLLGPVLGKVLKEGEKLAHVDSVISAARSTLKAGQQGFDSAIGLMQHQIDLHALTTIRSSFTGDALKGFDLAASLHVGRVSNPPPAKLPPAPIAKVSPSVAAQAGAGAAAGYYITKGMMGSDPVLKASMMTTIAAHPVARAGAVVAVKDVASVREGWFTRFLRALGLIASPAKAAA